MLTHKVPDNLISMVRANLSSLMMYQFTEFEKQENGFLMLGRFFSSQIFYAVNPSKSVSILNPIIKQSHLGNKMHGNIFTSDMSLSCTSDLRLLSN